MGDWLVAILVISITIWFPLQVVKPAMFPANYGMKRFVGWAKLLLVLVLLVIALVIFFVYSCQNPPDRVRVFVTNIPGGTNFLCLAALRDDRLVSMPWSPKDVFGSFSMHPADCIWSSISPSDRSTRHKHLYVPWQWGERYAVVTRTARDKWWITWFDPSAVSREGHKPLLGGGEVHLEMMQGVTEILSDRELRELGLDKVPTAQER